ncbi:hypothetical protein, partial [Clostridioides difficile]|uniref:hypothetical protein n=1 Tax=Clostridioides difficile TaxID=1496 RepID=UPI0018DCCDF1
FVGIEPRRHLLGAACDAKAVLRLGNARFVLGDAIRTSWLGFDGLYFFNPFGESLLAEPDRIDADVAVSSARFCDEARRCEEGLRELAV